MTLPERKRLAKVYREAARKVFVRGTMGYYVYSDFWPAYAAIEWRRDEIEAEPNPQRLRSLLWCFAAEMALTGDLD